MARLDGVRARGLAGAAVVSSAALLVAGCGGSSPQAAPKRPPGGSIAAILARPGANINAVPGTEDYAPGPVRVSFLLIDNQGAPVDRSGALVWVAASDDGRPFARTTARLEPVGVPGSEAAAGDITRLYVAHFSVPRPGIYTVVAETLGRKPMQAELHVQVREHPQAPAVGSEAIASRTPTIASTHGNLKALTTRTPPDTDLLRYSVAGSLASHKAFVLVFATPKFCTSRTCGPVVDVVDAVRKQFTGSGIRFIHVEIYKDNNPGLGDNKWVKEWHLPTEPWTFLVGTDGQIKARFEGSVSAGELAAAVRQYLS
jgi:hypothetical protein